MQFIDEETARDLAWEECWGRFHPLTPLGEEEKRKMRPFLPGDEEAWERTLDEQEEIRARLEQMPDLAGRLGRALRQLPDPSRVLELIDQGGVPSLTEWFMLKQFLWHARDWGGAVEEAGFPPSFWPGKAEAERIALLLKELNPSEPMVPAFQIEDAFDGRLADVRRRLRVLERQCEENREQTAAAVEREHGVRRTRLGEWVVSRGSDLERRLREDFRLMPVRETVYDVFFTLREENSPDLKALREEAELLERGVLRRLAEAFRPHVAALRSWMARIARFDLQWARWRAAATWRGTKPVHARDRLEVKGAFHPAMDRLLKERGQRVTPVDCTVTRGATVIVGPNMGGKTMALKTLGIIVVLAQHGFFVPAASCRMPLFPWVRSLIGDRQNMEEGLSSFGAEIARLGKWIVREDPGLLLLDEVGRGTNPVEGAALARAFTLYLREAPQWTVHVTHYREVLELEGIRRYRVAGLSDLAGWDSTGSPVDEALRRLKKRMDYRLIPLTEERNVPEEAIALAEAFGLDRRIVAEARRWMKEKGGKEEWKPN
jgi:DNA mismatch repair ATPase MutS